MSQITHFELVEQTHGASLWWRNIKLSIKVPFVLCFIVFALNAISEPHRIKGMLPIVFISFIVGIFISLITVTIITLLSKKSLSSYSYKKVNDITVPENNYLLTDTNISSIEITTYPYKISSFSVGKAYTLKYLLGNYLPITDSLYGIGFYDNKKSLKYFVFLSERDIDSYQLLKEDVGDVNDLIPFYYHKSPDDFKKILDTVLKNNPQVHIDNPADIDITNLGIVNYMDKNYNFVRSLSNELYYLISH